jgi:uncharacterized protein (DUF2147 family)
MIRAASSVIGIALLALHMSAPANAAAATPVGTWARADGATRITVKNCGADLCAVNVWVKDPGGDEAVGDKLVMTLKPKSDTELTGTAVDEKRNLTYDMTLTLDGSSMKTHGCVIAGLICKTADWSRVQ